MLLNKGENVIISRVKQGSHLVKQDRRRGKCLLGLSGQEQERESEVTVAP